MRNHNPFSELAVNSLVLLSANGRQLDWGGGGHSGAKAGQEVHDIRGNKHKTMKLLLCSDSEGAEIEVKVTRPRRDYNHAASS